MAVKLKAKNFADSHKCGVDIGTTELPREGLALLVGKLESQALRSGDHTRNENAITLHVSGIEQQRSLNIPVELN